MKRTVTIAIAALVSLFVGSPRAAAYSDPERFEAAPEEGGGGGRFFTGSPQDGYTCAVCHAGGAAPQVAIRGLPRAGYAPGQLVEVEVAFAPGPGNHALALEMLDAAGQSLELELPAETETAPAERCGAAVDGRRAAYLTRSAARRVVGLEACEARSVRFRFRTNESQHVLFAATVLASDSSASVAGDGVTEITETLFRDGRAARTTRQFGCSALDAHAEGSPSFASWLGLALAFALGSRRASRSISARTAESRVSRPSNKQA